MPVRYGLIRFRPEYLEAQRMSFPHAKTFVLGGCLIGSKKTAEVRYCRDCREAEQRWHEENPDFNDPQNVIRAVENARRDLPDSLGKRILRQSQLPRPERNGQWSWRVYQIGLEECVYFDTKARVYTHVDVSDNQATFDDAASLVDFLNNKYG